MLYLGSARPLPLRDWPEIQVEEVEDALSVVKSHFSVPEVQFIGAHTGCSCGFPSSEAEQPVEYYDGMFDDDADRAKDLESVRALLALIDEALPAGDVELFPVWVGEEADPPRGILHIKRSELTAERFILTRPYLYRVTAR